MRGVIIQIYSVYFAVFYLLVGILTYETPMAQFFLSSGVLNLFVAVKLSKFKAGTNMLYVSMFMHLTFLSNYFMLHNFLMINMDRMNEYIFRTMPSLLKGSYLLLNAIIVFLSFIEFANSRVME